MENEKLTKLEKYWILYDVGNSAFTLLVSTIIPIYFNALAGNAGISEVDYLAYWDMRHPYQRSLSHFSDRQWERWLIPEIIKSHCLCFL